MMASWSKEAYMASLCLVAIQVGIGVVMKASQSSHGHYDFSPTSSVTISEFFKLLLSLCFFGIECWDRARKGVLPKGSDDAAYALLPTPAGPGDRDDAAGSDDDEDLDMIEGIADKKRLPEHLTPTMFFHYIWNEISTRTKYDVCNLALMYVVVNNTIFACYNLSDPGTIALVKSSGTAMTALITIASIGTILSNRQWIAIALQLAGILVTQYKPSAGTAAYPIPTYMLIVFHVFVGAAAGVYNQVILKRDNASLHVTNIFLYAAGAVYNFASHLIVRQLSPSEPGFFDGYDKLTAVLVILSNVFVGLAITAVLKYADAVIKCFAQGVATGILLYLSTILFDITISMLAIPGTIVVFAASYLYIVSPAPRGSEPEDKPKGLSVFSGLSAFVGLWPRAVLGISTLSTFAIVTGLWAPLKPATPKLQLDSPLRNTVGFVRWNHPIPERLPQIRKYEPFFHTLHISMRDSLPGSPLDYVGLAEDQWVDTGNPTVAVAKTMQIVLDEHPDITGLLYFHFDAWIDPLGWESVNLDKLAIPYNGGPRFHCFANHSEDSWQKENEEHVYQKMAVALNATPPDLGKENHGLAASPKLYYTPQRGGCRSWADIYYVPRRLFVDYITLTMDVFYHDFHEITVATMMDLMNQTRSTADTGSLIEDLPCWGNCCARNPKKKAILSKICGHKFDLRKEDQAGVHFDRIDKDYQKLLDKAGKAAKTTTESN